MLTGLARFAGIRFSPGLYGASQSGTHELALAPSQDLAKKLWRAVLLTGIPVLYLPCNPCNRDLGKASQPGLM